MKRNNNNLLLYRFLTVVRIFLGLVFIFSSVVKGIDPTGTSYRVQDYLLAYGWTPLVPYAMWIAFLVIFSEFMLGIAFLFGIFIRTAAWGMLAMLAFFTVVTYLDARTNMVPDCGCFGDAVKLTNWQTFYKNILLISLNIFFLWGIFKRKKIRKNWWRQAGILVAAGGIFLWFMFYNLNHLPVIDFRNWKTGRDMTVVSRKPKIYVIYQNKKTGEKKTFLFPNYPWKDSTWMAQWTFVSQRTVNQPAERKYNLVIEDSLGNDCTKAIIENPGFQAILVSYNLRQADEAGLKKAAVLTKFLASKNIPVALLTASLRDVADSVVNRYGIKARLYQADETDLKAMIRSNPGMILMHHGVILKKWHFHDFPGKKKMESLLENFQKSFVQRKNRQH